VPGQHKTVTIIELKHRRWPVLGTAHGWTGARYIGHALLRSIPKKVGINFRLERSPPGGGNRHGRPHGRRDFSKEPRTPVLRLFAAMQS